MDTTDTMDMPDVAEWIEMPCGVPEREPTARPAVMLTSPVPRQGRGERPRVIQVRAPLRRRPRPPL